MHHAPMKPEDEGEWPTVRSGGSRPPRLVVVDIGRLDPRPLADPAPKKARPLVAKDRRRPGMY